MQPRQQAGDHAASYAQDHRQDGLWFAEQATRGKSDPGVWPALGTGGTGSPVGTGALVEPPRSRGQFQCEQQAQRDAIQPRRLARMG